MMTDRRVFECLCLEPSQRGYSYDSALLVDVDRAFDFDEAVIRLTTKCNSIVTQFRTLGHHFSEFSVAASKVDGGKADSALSPNTGNRRSKNDIEKMQSPSGSPETRNLRLMDFEWRRLKKKNYSGMVALARVTRSSIPRNGSGGRYSVKAFTEAVLSHIQAYFMFQSFCPEFERWMGGEEGTWSYGPETADDEYILYLVYRLRDKNIPPKPTTPTARRKWTEVDRLEFGWPFVPNTQKRRRRHTSGESNASTCSSTSTSSTPSGGPSYLTPPAIRSAQHAAEGMLRARTRSNTLKTPDSLQSEKEESFRFQSQKQKENLIRFLEGK
ncbi:uncharacterized protein LOC122259997 isoform X2 [Penaeus japonicus]|uniref:uncharacterized protein LOC122259997 isoform X2 n=1 Tax=Penaeus japonicus TaxID=27405 RepID=UPI001C70F40A|nr:uncharacterized protein LOC122259997 isoform X2 [Penaeus japonicus]